MSQLYETIVDFLDHFSVEYEDSNPKIMADILGIRPESYVRKIRDAREAVRRSGAGTSPAEPGVLHLFSNEQLSRFAHATYIPYEMLVRLNAGLPVFYDFVTNRYTTTPGHDRITTESIVRSVNNSNIRTMCKLMELGPEDFTKAVEPHLGRFLDADIAFGWQEYAFMIGRAPSMKKLSFKVCDRQNHCTGMVVTMTFSHNAFRRYCDSFQKNEPLIRNALHDSFSDRTPGNGDPVEVLFFTFFMASASPYIYAIMHQLYRNLTVLSRTRGFFAPDAVVAAETWTTENAELARAAGLKLDTSPTRPLRSGEGAISIYTVSLGDWDMLRDQPRHGSV